MFGYLLKVPEETTAAARWLKPKWRWNESKEELMKYKLELFSTVIFIKLLLI